jgi:hypothetical protein
MTDGVVVSIHDLDTKKVQPFRLESELGLTKWRKKRPEFLVSLDCDLD